MELDDFQKLNSFTVSEYKPDTLLLEAPKQGIWDSLKEDNISKDKELEAEKTVKKFEVSSSSKNSIVDTTKSSTASSGGWKPSVVTTTYKTVEKTPEEIVDKMFTELRDKAYEMAEEELKQKEPRYMANNNPQLDVLMKKKTGVASKIKERFSNGSWGKKGLLIVGALVTQTLAQIIIEAKQNIRKDK